MKSLLGKICLPRAIGLYIDDASVTLSHVVATPFGLVETDGRTESVGVDELPAVLERLLAPLRGWRGFRRVPVAIGLPAGRTYFSTRPISRQAFAASESELSPQVLLREALRSSKVSVGEMVVDVAKTEPDKRPVAGIVSCDKKYLAGLLDPLQECGVRPFRAEPAPCALLRAAAHQHNTRKGDKVVLRLFLCDNHVLGILVVGNLPIVWRQASLPYGDEPAAILSLSRALLTVSKDCGIDSPLDAVMLHGRPELPCPLEVDWLQEQLGVPVRWCDEPPLDDSQVAFGLALGCLKHDKHAFDLSQTLKSRASILEVFPWREASLQTALLVLMALLLFDRWCALSGSCESVRTQNAQHAWMESLDDPQLEKEKKELGEKVEAVHKFLDTRTVWTSCQRELSACIPDNVYFTAFKGVCSMESGGKKKRKGKKKSLVLDGAVSIPEDGLTPHEIDRFLNTLREHPMLKRDFPNVRLTKLKQVAGKRNQRPLALLTVVCSP